MSIMDKKKKIIYSIVLIIITLGLVGLSFYLGTQINKFTDNPNKNEENSKEENSLDDDNENTDKPYKNKNYTFVKEYKEEITLNNKKHTIVTYYYDDNYYYNNYDYDENKVYQDRIIRKETYMDNILIFNEPIYDIINCCYSNQNSYLKEIEDYHNKYSKYLKIKDSSEKDKEYLVLRDYKKIDDLFAFAEGEEETITIVKDNGRILSQIKSTNPLTDITIIAKKEAIGDRTFTTEDGNQLLYGNSFADIHDTYLYYISYEQNYDVVYYDYNVEEYKITIQNGIIEKIHTRTYYDGNEETEYGLTILAE